MIAADAQVFLDAQRGKQPSPFRRQSDAALEDMRRRKPADRLAGEAHRLARRRNEAGQGLQQRRFAGAVGADNGDGLAGLERDVDAVERLEVAVEGGEAGGREQAHTGDPR